MSDQLLRLILGGVLLLHGLGHGGAFGALLWLRLRPGSNTGGWLAARSWLVPALTGDPGLAVASAFWVVALVGFVAAALSSWGVLLPLDVWKPLAVASAIVSTAGIVLFFGTWPMFNTLAALGVNIAVLVAVLWLHWPPESVFRK
jgi:hypothetical protein